ncbi:RNA polymerase subunit sigma-24 [Leifsonia sp. LS1]|uniref:RNA polymerase sigma factor n=1 Tax=Leifsonia sp. LS1 TaxID=2828483 RepID=UPI001CFDA027|nr:sigma-70 family RNA polymerase sigma factor [Leifsonia sp. LS1]GIT79444.1 RNA polymerase subunit sigma-24 [Leifsonia sp. LS1]
MTTAIERAYRTEAPRILGAVARSVGDLQLAEDAVQEAFARAVAETARGRAPANPAAWITTVARRIAIDALRREATAARALPALAADEAGREARNSVAEGDMLANDVFTGDERLELILLVCHPEVTEETRVALALRFVCGVPTAQVAEVFLVPEATMAARLTRAKKRIHDSGLRFTMDDPEALSDRLPDALTTVYLLYTVGHARTDDRLRADAVELARDVRRIRPDDAEATALLALLLLTEARQATRVSAQDDFVTLADADRTRWDRALLAEGERLATAALTTAAGEEPGRFALQAAVAGLHGMAPTWETTDWPAIARLYDGLVRGWPSATARLGRIVARAYSPDVGPEAALAELDAHPDLFDGVAAAQALAVRADLLRASGERRAAADAYERALAAADDARVRRFLTRRRDEQRGA